MNGGNPVGNDYRMTVHYGGRTLAYDSENRLVSASSTAPGGSPFTLGYDPQGRMRGLAAGATAVGIDMVGTDIVTLRVNAGPPVERYAFAPGVDEPMVGYDNAGTRYYFHADGHGNVVARSDGAGTAIRTIGYDEYGRPSSYNSRFLHAGKMHLGTVNAYYNNARFYDYNLGRFLQTDPIGYDDQINLYAYVGNDPVNGRDPTGMAGCDTGSRIAGNSAFCQVADGYNGIADKVEGARQGRVWVHVRDPNSAEGRFVQLMIKDPDVVQAIESAWRASRGDRGPTGQKNEYGFWVRWLGGRNFQAGTVFRGDGAFIDRQSIARAREDLPGAQIFVHVHPFRGDGKELAFVRSIGISGLEKGGGDAGLALSFKSMIVSIARPEPYTGKGAYVDWVDYYWGRDRK